jgi:membrane protein
VTFFSGLLGALALMIIALGGVAVLPVVLRYIGLSNATEWLIFLGKWPVLFAAVACGIALIYRYGPSRKKPQWRWITWGSAAAAFSWLVMSILFSWYATHFGSYNQTYGTLGAAVGFMTWLWLSSVVWAQNSMQKWSIKRRWILRPDRKSR